MKLLLPSLCLIAFSASGELPNLTAEKAPPAKFTSAESIAAVIPDTIELKTGGKWNVVAVDQASNEIAAKALNQPATLRLKVHVFEPYKENGWAYRIMAPDDTIPARGTRLHCRTWVYFRPDQAEALAKIRKGSLVTFSGILGRADVKIYGDHATLSIDLKEAKVEKQ